jgi:probable phosphoglycerate mutase
MNRSSPAVLWLVRHGESLANVASEATFGTAAEEVDVTHRDADVPLSPRGVQQATALGRWFSELRPGERPTVVVASPYARALRTAEHVIEAGGTTRGGAYAPGELIVDERFREKEFGLFYRLTRLGIQARHPDQWALRAHLGRFYYRPPGGESWADVVLRVRAGLDTIARDYAGERVLVVCHQVVVLCARYVLERLSEQEILQVGRSDNVANCGVTTYRERAQGGLTLDRFNFTAPLELEGAAVTAEPTIR